MILDHRRFGDQPQPLPRALSLVDPSNAATDVLEEEAHLDECAAQQHGSTANAPFNRWGAASACGYKLLDRLLRRRLQSRSSQATPLGESYGTAPLRWSGRLKGMLETAWHPDLEGILQPHGLGGLLDRA